MKKIDLALSKVRRDYIRAARRYDLAAADRCLSLITKYVVILRATRAAFEMVLMDGPSL